MEWLEETKEFFETMLGKDSDLNLLGKVMLFPMILILGCTWAIMNILFVNKKKPSVRSILRNSETDIKK